VNFTLHLEAVTNAITSLNVLSKPFYFSHPGVRPTSSETAALLKPDMLRKDSIAMITKLKRETGYHGRQMLRCFRHGHRERASERNERANEH
jgi:hypothetical protein